MMQEMVKMVSWDEESLSGDYSRVFKKRMGDDRVLRMDVSQDPSDALHCTFTLSMEDDSPVPFYATQDEALALLKIRETITSHSIAIQEI